MKKICVIGSLNVDIVTNVNDFVEPGETIKGLNFNEYYGGKGANQSVALGRLGATVTMFGAVGDDSLGDKYISYLTKENVVTKNINILENTKTGMAIIEVDSRSENRIIIIGGANDKVTIEYIDENITSILENDIFLLQLEIPLETTIYLMKLLSDNNKTIILDPAPAIYIPDEIYKYIDYITPNETEIEILCNSKINSEETLYKNSKILLEKGVGTVIAKSGKKGAYIIKDNIFELVESFEVEAVDTIAAGDSFNAGLSYAISLDKDIFESVRFANAVAGLSVTGKGAHSSMPTYEKVQKFLENNK